MMVVMSYNSTCFSNEKVITISRAKTLPSLKFYPLIGTVWRQVEGHRRDFSRSAEIKTADMTRVPPETMAILPKTNV